MMTLMPWATGIHPELNDTVLERQGRERQRYEGERNRKRVRERVHVRTLLSLRRYRLEDQGFKIILSHIVSLRLACAT